MARNKKIKNMYCEAYPIVLTLKKKKKSTASIATQSILIFHIAWTKSNYFDLRFSVKTHQYKVYIHLLELNKNMFFCYSNGDFSTTLPILKHR